MIKHYENKLITGHNGEALVVRLANRPIDSYYGVSREIVFYNLYLKGTTIIVSTIVTTDENEYTVKHTAPTIESIPEGSLSDKNIVEYHMLMVELDAMLDEHCRKESRRMAFLDLNQGKAH